MNVQQHMVVVTGVTLSVCSEAVTRWFYESIHMINMFSADRAMKSCLIRAVLLNSAGSAVRSCVVGGCSSVLWEQPCLWCSCGCSGNLHLAWAPHWVRGILLGTVFIQGLLYFVVLTCSGFFSLLIFQDLIEKVVILRKAVQLTQAVDPNAMGALLAEKMSQYANLLAAQGSLAAALTFLPANTNQVGALQALCSLSVCEQVCFK